MADKKKNDKRHKEAPTGSDAPVPRKARIKTTLKFIQEASDEEFAEVFAEVARRIRAGDESPDDKS